MKPPKLTLVGGPSIPERVRALEVEVAGVNDRLERMERVLRRVERFMYVTVGVGLAAKFLLGLL